MLRLLWVACYDIGDDRQRRRLDLLLAGAGERAQYSVFELWLSAHERQRLVESVAQTVDLSGGNDSLRWYPLCSACQRQIQFVGRGEKAEDPRFYLV